MGFTVVSFSSGTAYSGCDSDTKFTSTAESACLFGNTPYYFIGRYISNTDYEQSGDLSNTELTYLTQEGWAVAVIQHALAGGTTLTESLGVTIANNAISNAESISAPSGTTLWLDVENFAADSSAQAFCAAWGDTVNRSGNFGAGLYYGSPGLTSSEVQYLLDDQLFFWAWSGCGQVTGIGESLRQGPCDTSMSGTCNGVTYTVSIDEDTKLSTATVGGFVAYA